jgi:hypothetical protein
MSNGTVSTADVSIPNNEWGICGFTSCIGAMCEAGLIGSVQKDHLKTRLLAEIKTYLELLRADENPLRWEIEKFTRTFPGYQDFSIVYFVKDISVNKDLTAKKGLAMPPRALVDYLQRCWDMKKAYLANPTATMNNVILGLGQDKDLKHWVYKRDNSCVYNWGVKKTLAEVMKECSSFSNGVAYQVAGF